MKKIVIILGFGVCIFVVWNFFGQNDEKKIKKVIQQIESTLTAPAPTAVPEAIGRMNKISRHLLPTVYMSLSTSEHPNKLEIKSQSEAEGLILQFFKSGYKIEKPFVEISSLMIEPPKAVIQINITAKKPSGEDILLPTEIRFQKEKKSWLIQHVQTPSD